MRSGDQDPPDADDITDPPSASPGEVLKPGTSEGDNSAAELAKGSGAAGEYKSPWWKFWE